MIIIGCLWLFLTGLGIVHWCLPSARFTEKAALAFPVSAGLHAAVFFLLIQSRQASVWWSSLPFLPFLIILGGMKIGGSASQLPAGRVDNASTNSGTSALAGKPVVPGPWYPLSRARFSFLESVAILFVLFTSIQVCVHVFFVPAVEWDCIAQWFLKGKVLVVEGRITPDLISWLKAQGLTPDYPWNVPLMYAWLSGLRGFYSELACKAIVFAFYISLLLILYNLARLRFQRAGALLALSVYLAIPDAVVQVFNRDADTILETYLAAVIFLVLRQPLNFSTRTAVLLAAVVFLASWTKREGMIYCAALLVPWIAWLTWKKAARGLLLPMAAGSVLGILTFWVVKHMFGATTTTFAQGLAAFHGIPGEFQKLGSILYLMAAECLKVHRWNFVWLLVPFLFWSGRDRYRLRILLASHVMLYFLVYYFAPIEFRWHISTSWSRLLLHLLPELYALGVFVTAEYWPAGISHRALTPPKPQAKCQA